MPRCWSLFTVMLAVPFSVMLSSGYRVTNFEPWVVSALFGFAGLCLGWLVSRRTWAFALTYSMAIYWFIDANIFDSGWLIGLPSLGIVFGLMFLMRWIEEWAVPVTSMFALLFSATAILNSHTPTLLWTGPETIISAAKDRPALLHLIVDEFMSPLAVPETIPDGHPAQSILDRLVARGFSVQTHANSISGNTYRSVSATVGMTNELDNYKKGKKGSKFTYTLKNTEIFDRLASLGYGISIIQSNFLDLCLNNPEWRCGTYTRANNMEVFSRMGVPWQMRMELAFVAVHQAFTGSDRAKVPLYEGVTAPFFGAYGYFSRPVVVVEMLNELAAGKYVPEKGQALVAHLLLPHFPYILNADCTIKPIQNWKSPSRHAAGSNEAEIYSAYWDQAACVMSRLELLLDKVQDRDDLVIVMHGDHGSRITKDTPQENDVDVLMTFFAERGTNIAPVRNDSTVVLQNATRQFYEAFLED
jgi:hypothetical protein